MRQEREHARHYYLNEKLDSYFLESFLESFLDENYFLDDCRDDFHDGELVKVELEAALRVLVLEMEVRAEALMEPELEMEVPVEVLGVPEPEMAVPVEEQGVLELEMGLEMGLEWDNWVSLCIL